jgi:hypothetical protein
MDFQETNSHVEIPLLRRKKEGVARVISSLRQGFNSLPLTL